jgi:ABC-type transport system involved in cytochrome bd biosynthesis fused ATPase/permease subunit
VARARARPADFPIVILDEPTEHLDEETARALIGDLLEETRGRTVLLITHRTDLLKGVDEIASIEDGKIDHIMSIAQFAAS